MEKDPHKRFASVQAFANALEQASRNPADVTLPVNLPPRFPKGITMQSQPQQLTEHAIPLSQIAGPITITSSLSQTSYLPHEVTSLGKPRSKRGISRRKAMIGLIGFAGLVGTGGAVWLLLSPRSLSPKLLSPKLLSPKPLYEYDGHSSIVRDVAWSPHGGRIASASDDGTVQVWDATTGGNVFTYRDQSSGVYRLDWSPDGKQIVSGGYDNTARVWDVTNGNTIFTYHGHSGIVYAVSWSPDGTRIASGGNDNTVQVWDATTGNHVSIYHGHSTNYPAIYEVAWSPDGKYIASVDNFETVHIWHADTGNDVFIYHANGQVWTGVWSPNSKYIAFANSGNTSANTGGTVEVVDTGNWSTIYTYRGHSSSLAYGHSVTWASDSMRIASAEDKEMHIWDATTGNNISISRGKFDYAIKWSPDGKFIASIAGRPDYTIEVWQIV
jgi:eukaryotic-like serine/threonine-protein kinase